MVKVNYTISNKISISIEKDLLEKLKAVNVKNNPFNGGYNSLTTSFSVDDIIDAMSLTLVNAGLSKNMIYNDIKVKFH